MNEEFNKETGEIIASGVSIDTHNVIIRIDEYFYIPNNKYSNSCLIHKSIAEELATLTEVYSKARETIKDNSANNMGLISHVHYDSLCRSYAQLQRDINALKEENATLRNNSIDNTFKEKYDAISKDYDSLLKSCRATEEKYNTIRNDYDNLKELYNATVDSYNNLLKDYSVMQVELGAFRNENKTLKEENKQLKTYHDSYKDNLERLRNERNNLREQLKVIKNSYTSDTTELDKVRKERDSLKNELKELYSICNNYERDCNALKDELKRVTVPSHLRSKVAKAKHKATKDITDNNE